MTRAAINWITGRTNKQRRWIAAGIVVVGLAGMNHEPRGAAVSQSGGSARTSASGSGMEVATDRGEGITMGGGAAASQIGENVPAARSEISVPRTGGFVSTPTATGDSATTVPTSGDSVPESVNTNFSDYMRDQQRVVSENDGQTYVVNANADPNQMTDTRDSVSGFSAATPGSDAAGYAAVAPSGATTVDTSTATPVDTSSTSSTTAGE